MLSNDEYRNIIWKLDHVPENLHGQQRQNYTRLLRQQTKEHEYATKFIPFEPLPHIPYFINRTTTKQCLHQLIKAATVSPEFTLDTESMNIYKKENKPTLIQLQIFLPHHSSCALIIEMYHLPNENHICFKLIKDLIEIIFSQDKKLYTWGSINELKPFVIFKLFSYEQLNRMNPINLQENFKIFWNQQHPHKSSSSTSSNSSSDNRLCEACIGIGPSEIWSLQNSVAFELNEYLPKKLTNQGFNMGLDPNLRHMDSKEKHYRQQLSTYALNDCL
ncbi:unnamed protein product [Rotaria sp. Silwood2]|nr:unnamed protein product [Rotaria sp. Silwood2]